MWAQCHFRGDEGCHGQRTQWGSLGLKQAQQEPDLGLFRQESFLSVSDIIQGYFEVVNSPWNLLERRQGEDPYLGVGDGTRRPTRFLPVLSCDLVRLGGGSSGDQKEPGTTSDSFIDVLVSEIQHDILTARSGYWYI